MHSILVHLFRSTLLERTCSPPSVRRALCLLQRGLLLLEDVDILFKLIDELPCPVDFEADPGHGHLVALAAIFVRVLLAVP